MQFDVTEPTGEIIRVALDGRMDAVGAEKIETSFTTLASASGKHVILDLSGVPFIGSLGVRLLIGSARVVHRCGRKMVLFGAQTQAQEVFETVALSDLIPIASTEAEALALIGG